MKWLPGCLALVAMLLSACGSAPQDEVLTAGTSKSSGPPVLVASTSPSDLRITISKGSWVRVQEVAISVETPGSVFVTASGGELVERELSGGAIPTWIALSQAEDMPPQVVSTVPSYWVYKTDSSKGAYVVPAYSLNRVYHISQPGIYTYALYAKGSEDPTAILPGSLVALFVPAGADVP